eukprot:586031-Rhodomonas_salina.3
MNEAGKKVLRRYSKLCQVPALLPGPTYCLYACCRGRYSKLCQVPLPSYAVRRTVAYCLRVAP